MLFFCSTQSHLRVLREEAQVKYEVRLDVTARMLGWLKQSLFPER